MGKICIIILISDQLIQNVMFIKWFLKNKPQTDLDLVCITSPEMEKKHKMEAMENALAGTRKFFSAIRKITVDENDVKSIIRELEKAGFDRASYREIHINTTGGTKPMSIAGFEFFKDWNNAVFYYQPILNPLRVIYPEPSEAEEVEIPITLREYFAAYGVSFDTDCRCVKDWEYNRKVFPLIEEFKSERNLFMKIQNDNHFKPKLKKGPLEFENMNRERLKNSLEVEDPQSAIARLRLASEKFGFGRERITGRQIKYMTGGWFEEFVYQKIKEEKKLSDEFIALNLIIRKNHTNHPVDQEPEEKTRKLPNELDVVYIEGLMNPVFHIVECKSFLDEESQSKLLTDTLYKMQALKKDFGLNVRSHLYTMSVIQKESALARAADLGIEIVDGTQLREQEE